MNEQQPGIKKGIEEVEKKESNLIHLSQEEICERFLGGFMSENYMRLLKANPEQIRQTFIDSAKEFISGVIKEEGEGFAELTKKEFFAQFYKYISLLVRISDSVKDPEFEKSVKEALK